MTDPAPPSKGLEWHLGTVFSPPRQHCAHRRRRQFGVRQSPHRTALKWYNAFERNFRTWYSWAALSSFENYASLRRIQNTPLPQLTSYQLPGCRYPPSERIPCMLLPPNEMIIIRIFTDLPHFTTDLQSILAFLSMLLGLLRRHPRGSGCV